jgi:hypothetical protein
MTPIEMLEHLKAITTMRTHKTLDAVFNACKEQKERGSTDFSYAMIARVGKVYGVPAAQSLRNQSGANYRALIDTFVATLPLKQKEATGPYSWIEALPMGEQKLLTKILLAELKAAERKLREIVPPNMVFEVDVRPPPSATFKLSPGERRALEYLCSAQFLTERSLKRGERSDVVGSNGEQLFKPGTLDAFKKALKYL